MIRRLSQLCELSRKELQSRRSTNHNQERWLCASMHPASHSEPRTPPQLITRKFSTKPIKDRQSASRQYFLQVQSGTLLRTTQMQLVLVVRSRISTESEKLRVKTYHSAQRHQGIYSEGSRRTYRWDCQICPKTIKQKKWIGHEHTA